MKILIFGGHGVIGKKVAHYFGDKHDLIIAGRTRGDVTVNINNVQSIAAMYHSTGTVDAVINIAGEAKWETFETLTEEDYYVGIQSKLMGQVNLVRLGKNYVTAGGSITLTTGILADHPVAQTTSAAMVNGAIHSFVRAVALEMPNNIRVNVVSPGLVEDSVEKYGKFFPGHNPIPMSKVVNGYVRSVEGWDNGQVITIYDQT